MQISNHGHAENQAETQQAVQPVFNMEKETYNRNDERSVDSILPFVL